MIEVVCQNRIRMIFCFDVYIWLSKMFVCLLYWRFMKNLHFFLLVVGYVWKKKSVERKTQAHMDDDDIYNLHHSDFSFESLL